MKSLGSRDWTPISIHPSVELSDTVWRSRSFCTCTSKGHIEATLTRAFGGRYTNCSRNKLLLVQTRLSRAPAPQQEMLPQPISNSISQFRLSVSDTQLLVKEALGRSQKVKLIEIQLYQDTNSSRYNLSDPDRADEVQLLEKGEL